MKLKTNDNVMVIAGKEKGKTGKIIQVFHREEKVVVEGLNKLSKHLRSRKSGEKGQKIEFSAPLHVSNVRLVCGKCGKNVSVGYKVSAAQDGKMKKYRVCRKCGEAV